MAPFSPRRPSAAMVVSVTALIVALGGTSYAAVVLPKNSVGSRQIKPRAVKASDVATGAITSAKVKDRTLKSTDFKLGQLAAGRTGDTGLTGPSDIYMGTGAELANPRIVTVHVPAGTYAVTAKALFTNNVAGTSILCGLYPVETDSVSVTTDYSGLKIVGVGDYASLANLGTKRFTAPGTFTYTCTSTGTTGYFQHAVVIATKVGARH
jgi:hypothetical protein